MIVEIAVCAFASAHALKVCQLKLSYVIFYVQVTPYLVLRDTVFYLVGLTLLAYFFLDNKIKW